MSVDRKDPCPVLHHHDAQNTLRQPSRLSSILRYWVDASLFKQ